MVTLGGAVAVAERLNGPINPWIRSVCFRPVTKFSVEIDAPRAVSEVVANAFRAAESGRPGAAFISLPQDVMNGPADGEVIASTPLPAPGPGGKRGCRRRGGPPPGRPTPRPASWPPGKPAPQRRGGSRFLGHGQVPVVSTYQAAGVVPREFLHLFGGRVGLFHNQPADRLLDAADLVTTVGYDPVEYDPQLWNKGSTLGQGRHIDVQPADIDNAYQPVIELQGDVAATLQALTTRLPPRGLVTDDALLGDVRRQLDAVEKA